MLLSVAASSFKSSQDSFISDERASISAIELEISSLTAARLLILSVIAATCFSFSSLIFHTSTTLSLTVLSAAIA